ncbi:uncharacterized protein LOC133195139 [Saccostrea echinata]|uniref:uncharacterized protein LOC133195139 n=1 Tax=Saccostrea echinata TaxID=191078 RepID=UPI002A82884B|nr:uncharacterized protein LOC133195139 [Saccostrea echinata]
MRAVYFLVTWFDLLYNRENVMCEVKRYTWFDAQEICRGNNSVLIRKAIHNSSEYFWVGHYRRKSTLIKISGCYPERILQTFSLSYDMQRLPSAGFCQEICLSFNKTIFAIKGSECKCLQNPPNLNEELPSDTCNVTCNIGADTHYFDECGGQKAFSVFHSDMENNKYTKNDSFCIGIHCTKFPKFYLESNCTRGYKPLCQSCDVPEKRPFGTWSDAMKYCKSANSSSYLFSNVFLNDINRTCTSINSVFTQPSWIGVAAELYNGIDREESNVSKIVIPVVVVITCLVGGCSAVLLKMRKRRQKQSSKTMKTKHGGEWSKYLESHKDVTEDHSYFTLEALEQSTKVSNGPNIDLASPSKDETYDHLRGTFVGTKKANRENDYDTASKIAEKLECHYTENTKGDYDHLRENNVKIEDTINSGYSHVLPRASEQSDYDIASRITKNEIRSIYSHVNTNQ